MSLQNYQKKRRFPQTPEPRAKITRKKKSHLHFVIQKHAASHLHYDLRLEMDGVLKSWAVPKGPSLNPREKRLAIAVEDHPYEYKDFEGVIPPGNYGAGNVIIWDEGSYEPISALPKTENGDQYFLRALHKGHLKFILHGKKLQGEFHLIKLTKSNQGKNAWLFFKADDAFATKKDILKADKSVRSQKTVTQIAKTDLMDLTKSHLPKTTMPEAIKPMLAGVAPKAFDRQNWWFEIKWDGFRILAYVDHKQVHLVSRNQQNYSQVFAPITHELAKENLKAVFDGEMVVVDSAGRSRFQLLQQWRENQQGQLVYYVFDLLWLNGYDLQQLPLAQRKQLLTQILPRFTQIKISAHIENKGKEFFKTAVAHGLEGIIAKNSNSRYLAGKRSDSWLKIKNQCRQEAIICGYTAPRGSRKIIGALILAVYERHQLRYIGHTDGALDEQTKLMLKQRLDRLQQTTSPFDQPPKTNAPVTWVKPQLVCEVGFVEWTKEGHLRQPIFLGLREDKLARSVYREALEKPEKSAFSSAIKSPKHPDPADEKIITVSRRQVKLSHVSKIYWPEDGYTKMDLLDYYQRIAKLLLVHLKNRPEVLHRHPEGIDHKGFYQKNFTSAPDWLQTAQIYSTTENKTIEYLLCQNTADLLYIVNLGCIEINPWLSRITSLEQPDFCVLDLDPEDIEFSAVIKTAQAIHRLLTHLGVESFCKTSGATGLHIFIPLGAQYSYEQSRQFAQLIAHLINDELPDITSIKRMPAQRQGRVYIDYLQNRHGQTLAAPYSVRPRPQAPVSTPLFWQEVKPGLKPESFTIQTIQARLAKIGDIWPRASHKGINLAACLKKLTSL